MQIVINQDRISNAKMSYRWFITVHRHFNLNKKTTTFRQDTFAYLGKTLCVSFFLREPGNRSIGVSMRFTHHEHTLTGSGNQGTLNS
ncbi:hypothetical protein ACFL50_06250 [Candidatus Latescibacterota bacterium]